MAQQQSSAETEEAETKPDVKPRRLATTYLGPSGLLRMIGSGDEDHIITRVVPGTDPMQDFEDDDPSQFIVIDDDTDASSDVDDLSEVSMASAVASENRSFRGSCQTSQHSTNEWQLLWTPWPQGSKTCRWTNLKRRQ